MAEKKIAIYRFMSAGCNGCDVQIFECLVPRYKLGDLGVEIVFTPEEANVLAVTGSINVKGAEELKMAYKKLKPPKIVVAVGNCATTKGIFSEGYPIVGPPDRIVPVNLYIPGCPPRPQAIVSAIAKALGVSLDKKEDYWGTPEGFRGKHEFDAEKCIGCGACAQVCSSDAIEIIDEDDKRLVKINYARCTFCGFCQDECPTQAIRLTKEYHLSTDNKKTAYVMNEVEMLRCRICGSYYVPSEQIRWAVERIMEKAAVYRDLRKELEDAMQICPECRRKIVNVENAKKLLTSLAIKTRVS
ncbi:4Fe-4S binding protein [Candidatus Bathyarchaeota archaeon]|nr:4Fe-4S binding protein [Candidatus Bathyarchaeota archaeon]